MESETGQCVRVLCPKKSLLSAKDAGLRWLIGSPLFVPPFTVVSSFRCLHALPGDPYSPDFAKEADEIRVLLLRGFDVIGAIFIGNGNWENGAWKAVEASNKIRKLLFGDGDLDLIGVATDLITGDIQFFVSHSRNLESVEAVSTVAYEDNPEKYVWEKGCLLRCELELKLPLFVLVDNRSDVAKIVSSLTGAAAAKLKDPHVAYLVEGSNISSEESSHSIVFHGIELDLSTDHSNSTLVKASAKESSSKALGCSHFCFKKKEHLIINYERATEQARYLNVSFKLDVLCYASEDFTIAAAISKSIVPGLVDQLNSIKKIVIPELLSQQPQRCPYHFLPPGLLHPITAMYDIRYGEIGMKQGEIRKFLHSRLGLPLDRPLLRIANALGFGMKSIKETHMVKCGSPLLKDVHTEIPSSGVSGGIISLIDGSYEYYGSPWEIHQALVDIGDKELSFVGPYEWIGAIELSYVLDKLLGVSCKIINVRSGEELPEKCRELSMRFETQGTPIMIGGGVLAYTLLGVDYNEMSGDCAFLILDPHYTGNDDLKKIVNGGWCGWKKAVDSKGRNFFLKDRTSSTISFHKGPTWFENPSDVLARGMRSYRDLANIEGMDVCR